VQFLREVVISTLKPQCGEGRTIFRLYRLPCLAVVALPGAYAASSISLPVGEVGKPPLHDKASLGAGMDTGNVCGNTVALVRERTIPTKQPPKVSDVSANFC
jgi:hypothetical protein